MNLIRVSGSSHVGRVAHAIAGIVRADQRVVVEATGVAEVNRAIKAMALARDYLQVDDIEISFVPEMEEVRIGEQIKSVLRFTIVRLAMTTRYLGNPRLVVRTR